MSEAKEAIIGEDGSQGDDTEELYQSVFTKTEETRFLKNMLTNLRRGFIPFNLTSFPRRKKDQKRRGEGRFISFRLGVELSQLELKAKSLRTFFSKQFVSVK